VGRSSADLGPKGEPITGLLVASLDGPRPDPPFRVVTPRIVAGLSGEPRSAHTFGVRVPISERMTVVRPGTCPRCGAKVAADAT